MGFTGCSQKEKHEIKISPEIRTCKSQKNDRSFVIVNFDSKNVIKVSGYRFMRKKDSNQTELNTAKKKIASNFHRLYQLQI
jgi:hypothetical protein